MLMTIEDDGDNDEKGSEQEEGTEYETDILSMAMEVAREVYSSISNVSFVHVCCFEQDMDRALTAIIDQLRGDIPTDLEGVTIDTGAKRKSVMNRKQYHSYQRKFGREIPILNYDKGLKGIGGVIKVIGYARIQIPFLDLGTILEIYFAIVDQDCPSLL